ncbi:MAG: YdcF family protein [Pseudomonadota bacterium]
MRRIRQLGLAAVAIYAVLVIVIGASHFVFIARALDPAEVAKADAIITLSGDLDQDGNLGPFSRARVATAVALYEAGVAPRLLMSGGLNRRTGKVLSFEMLLYAKEQGVNEAAFFVDAESVSTFENARYSLAIAEEAEWDRVVLVTDGFHLLRTWALFEYWAGADGPAVIALAPADGLTEASPLWALWIVLREGLAYPYNGAKIIGYEIQKLFGAGDQRIVR